MLHADAGGIARAAAILANGGVVAVPTETVYGLAARADSAEAVARIYATKGRPDFNPLIVHVSSLDMARELAEFDAPAEQLADSFWPGPLTMVLPLRTGAPVARAVTAGLPTIGIRMPAHLVTREVIKRLGGAIAAPSANRSNAISPTRPEHVFASFGPNCPPVLDAGASTAGLESTIIALDAGGGWRMLRPGPISAEDIAHMLGPESDGKTEAIEAPGQMPRHYSPGKPLLLNQVRSGPETFLIGFGEISGDVSLSVSGDLAEAASRLYDCLHVAAASEAPMIAVAPIPDVGIGTAINDRLKRAAA